jgi:F0F1-type ATP synthase membrane subunit a
MSTEGGATAYIVHHLTPLSVGEGFWALHLDTLFFFGGIGYSVYFILQIRRRQGYSRYTGACAECGGNAG